MCPVQNGVDLVEVSIFYKSEKTSGQTVLSDEDKNSNAFYYHGCLVFRLFYSFYYVLGISSQKIKSSEVIIFLKIGQDRGERNSADQDRKVTAFISFSCPLILIFDQR